MVLQAIKYQRGKLEILDQLKLPHQEVYVGITSAEEAWSAIKLMQVRGAPAIAIVAILSLAVWGATYDPSSSALTENAPKFLSNKLKYLVTSRPTAVNLAEAASRLDALLWNTWNQSDKSDSAGLAVIERYIEAAEQMLVDDVKDNENIGKYGAEWISLTARAVETEKFSVLTHCNTGYKNSTLASSLHFSVRSFQFFLLLTVQGQFSSDRWLWYSTWSHPQSLQQWLTRACILYGNTTI